MRLPERRGAELRSSGAWMEGSDRTQGGCGGGGGILGRSWDWGQGHREEYMAWEEKLSSRTDSWEWSGTVVTWQPPSSREAWARGVATAALWLETKLQKESGWGQDRDGVAGGDPGSLMALEEMIK